MDAAPERLTEEERYLALGRHLLALRKQRGWSQINLSQKSGVSELTIRAIERQYQNARQRSRSTLIALSQGFGLPNDYLINYLDNPPPEALRSQAGAGENPPRQSVLDLIAQGIQEIMTLLTGTVIPRLEKLEKQQEMIVNAHYPGDRDSR